MKFYCGGAKRTPPVCDFESDEYWLGRCPQCGRPYKVMRTPGASAQLQVTAATLTAAEPPTRIPTGISTLDNTVLGGGLVPGKVYLIAAGKGSGKSSLMTQVCEGVATGKRRALYISGEESAESVGEICRRNHVSGANIMVVGDTCDIDVILNLCKEHRPVILIVDSLQVMTTAECDGSEGSSSQAEAVINRLQSYCSKSGLIAWVMNHMQKGGKDLAGPEAVGHIVDAVFFLDRHEERSIRVLHAPEKNRTASTEQEAYFRMEPDGYLKPIRPPTHLTLVGDDE